MKNLRLLSLLPCCFLWGCTYTYLVDSTDRALELAELKPRHSLSAQRGYVLAPGTKLYVATAADATPIEVRTTLAKEFVSQAQYYFPVVELAEDASSIEQALVAAAKARLQLVVYLQLVYLEGTLGSVDKQSSEVVQGNDYGLDAVKLRVSLWDVNSRKFIDSTLISSRTPVFYLGHHTLEDLFPAAIHRYLAQLALAE